jgi:undecaprenyl phosphate N,N'-diacetylbacillosamine 1-phosphate transferase
MNFYFRYGKRVLDILLSLFFIVLAFPLATIILMMYALTFSYPPFYKQKRIGRRGEIFTLAKFRSLKNGPGTLEERRFVFGDFLRSTSLDELPQLFHVLSGKMSLVGPRPLPAEYLALFSEAQQRRHSVRPGLTGLAQVNGRNAISWNEKFEMDVYYVNHISMTLDVSILLRTIILVLSFKRDVSLAEEKFTGN